MTKGVLSSPWVYDSGGDYQGRHVTVTVQFATGGQHNIQRTDVHRDPGCVYTKLICGAGNSDPTKVKILDLSQVNGDLMLNPREMLNLGFNTIEDVLTSGSITASP